MANKDRPHSSRGAQLVIIGAGNLGQALARGWVAGGYCSPADIVLTRRDTTKLESLAEEGFRIETENPVAVRQSQIIVIAVQPQQVADLLAEIADAVDPDRHRLISVVSGVSIDFLLEHLGKNVPVVRAMPNTGVSIGESMTCLCARREDQQALSGAVSLFEAVGATLEISEDMMVSATALCACGVAFFLRSIRAASQGGIEIGFHPEEALFMAAQTAKGAAAILLREGRHPEAEIDRVTTPRGCTIAGLNEMEHQGFSSALIKGILVSAANARGLLKQGS